MLKIIDKKIVKMALIINDLKSIKKWHQFVKLFKKAIFSESIGKKLRACEKWQKIKAIFA